MILASDAHDKLHSEMVEESENKTVVGFNNLEKIVIKGLESNPRNTFLWLMKESLPLNHDRMLTFCMKENFSVNGEYNWTKDRIYDRKLLIRLIYSFL